MIDLQVLRGDGAVKLPVQLDDAPSRQGLVIPQALMEKLLRGQEQLEEGQGLEPFGEEPFEFEFVEP